MQYNKNMKYLIYTAICNYIVRILYRENAYKLEEQCVTGSFIVHTILVNSKASAWHKEVVAMPDGEVKFQCLSIYITIIFIIKNAVLPFWFRHSKPKFLRLQVIYF